MTLLAFARSPALSFVLKAKFGERPIFTTLGAFLPLHTSSPWSGEGDSNSRGLVPPAPKAGPLPGYGLPPDRS